MFRRFFDFIRGRKPVRSRLYRTEVFFNKNRKFGAEGIYFPVIVVSETGEERRGYFTEAQMQVAIERYEKNPEDWIE